MNNREWFREAKFGLMSHFGLYSVLDGYYKGKTCNEWARRDHTIPYDEYHSLAKTFNPIYLDTDEWIRRAKDAGMKYYVLTAKHHEGFALFKSKVSQFNVVDATPYGKDIVGMFAESCYKYGLKFGVYYSQDLDWDDVNAGGTVPTKYCEKAANFWDFDTPFEKRDFSKYFNEKVKPQVAELLTNYGDICLIWFDCPWTITKEQSVELYDFVKSYQSECLVSSRLGNGIGDYGSGGDNEEDMKSNGGLAEAPCTLSGTGCWCYSTFDLKYKTADEVIDLKNSLNDRGCNLLLNIGPDHLGRIPMGAIEVLDDLAKKNIK